MHLNAEMIHSRVIQARFQTHGADRKVRGGMETEYTVHAVQRAGFREGSGALADLLAGLEGEADLTTEFRSAAREVFGGAPSKQAV